nr:MAG: hypothetical protein 2 [Marnaviridae sp.]
MDVPLSPSTLKVLEDFCKDPYTPQSELIPNSGNSSMTKENIVTFVDNDTAAPVGASAGNHAFSCKDMTVDTSISEFLSRPVRISSFTWLESDTIGVKVINTPWHLWATNPFVLLKLNNYSWFRGDLKLKIQLTASPFYYGMMKVVSQPLHNFTPTTIISDTGTRYLIPASTRPHITLIPGEASSYEMTIPFIWPTNWLNIQSATAFQDLGRLRYTIWSQLQSANGVTSSGISVVTYAWIENLELSGASVGYAAQSDEYGDGPISKPASAIAEAAGALIDVPIIGPFATATQIGAKAVSSIARLFGYTNVPVIADTQPVRNEQFPKLASADIGYPVEKLTTDPKCELSVDPRIVGLPSGEDELIISSLCKRESWLVRSTWSTSQAVDTLLFQSRVNPMMFDVEPALGVAASKLYFTPMAFVSNCFDHWRGSIIFRFQVVASKYHQGRLLINFDPSGYTSQNIGNTVATSGVVHTAIIDIGQTQDVEFHVPFQQAAQFLTVRPGIGTADKNWTTSTANNWNYNSLYDNGYLSVRILNALTAPIATSTVDVHVFVRAGDDIEFANPTEVDVDHRLSLYAQQSEEFNEDVVAKPLVLAPTMTPDDQQYLVHYGERIVSLRQLLRRYNLHTIEGAVPNLTANTVSTLVKKVFKMPMSPGYCNFGYNLANGIDVPGSTFNYNWCNFTLLSYLSPAFLCYRGSTSWSFNFNSQTKLMGHIRTYRDNQGLVGSNASCSTVTSTVGSVSRLAKIAVGRPAGLAGSSLINANTQSGMNVQIPNMSPYKFCSTHTAYANVGQVFDGSILDSLVLESDWSTTTNSAETSLLYTYVAVGTDFNLHYFLNVPTFYVYSGIPAAP